MGGACCAKTDALPEDYIISIYSSLKIRKYTFEFLYENVVSKEFSTTNLRNISSENIHFQDFKKITESFFYDVKNPDEIHYNMHKHIFEQLVKFYTKPNGQMSVIDILTLFLFLIDTNVTEKAKYFYEMHHNEFENSVKFKACLKNYIMDTVFLLSNLPIYYCENETPDSLYYYLISFTIKKVEIYFEKNLHIGLSNLSGDSQRFFDFINEINLIFNFFTLRRNFNQFLSEELLSDFSEDTIKIELISYSQSRKLTF